MDERAAMADCRRDLFRALYRRILAECDEEDRARLAKEPPISLEGNPRYAAGFWKRRAEAALERVSALESALEAVMKASSWTGARKAAFALLPEAKRSAS